MTDESYIVVVISPDRHVHREIEAALFGVMKAESVWVVPDYPELVQLERLRGPESRTVLFLDFSDPTRARRIAAELDYAYHEIQVIAILGVDAKRDLMDMMQLGIREVINNPISHSEVVLAFTRSGRRTKGLPEAGPRNIFAFVPAKPGAGASTIAHNVAAAVARISKQRTLLLDFDLRLGVTSFLLKLDGRHSVQDALNQSPNLDETLWNHLVCTRNGLEILGSAPLEMPCEPSPEAYRAVLTCAQSLYSAICVDLAGAMELHEMETLHRAKEIFLICNSDVTSIHMAKRKSESLHRLHLRDKVSLVVNRVERRGSIPIGDLEKVLELPVRFLVPGDERSVTRAVYQGDPVPSDTPLGVQLEAIARSITGVTRAVEKQTPVRRFIEYFSVSPERENLLKK